MAHPYPTGTFTLQETPSFLDAITPGMSCCWKQSAPRPCSVCPHVVRLLVHVQQEGQQMDAITYTHARSHLAETMEKVCDDHAPVIITRKNQRSVVILSLEDYQALEETAYLLRSPKNARRLLEAIAELEAGGGTERELLE